MAEEDVRPRVTVRDPRDQRLDSLNRQPFTSREWNPPKPATTSEAELVALAHQEYVRVPNEPHSDRLLRVVRAITKALGANPGGTHGDE